MDKQIEELANDLQEAWTAWSLSKDLKTPYAFVAEILAKKWQPKMHQGAVVLTEDNAEEIENMIVKSPQMQEAMLHLIKAWQKETAEKFAKKLKGHLKESYHNLYHAEYRKGMVPINLGTLNKNIDEICKELVDE